MFHERQPELIYLNGLPDISLWYSQLEKGKQRLETSSKLKNLNSLIYLAVSLFLLVGSVENLDFGSAVLSVAVAVWLKAYTLLTSYSISQGSSKLGEVKEKLEAVHGFFSWDLKAYLGPNLWCLYGEKSDQALGHLMVLEAGVLPNMVVPIHPVLN